MRAKIKIKLETEIGITQMKNLILIECTRKPGLTEYKQQWICDNDTTYFKQDW